MTKSQNRWWLLLVVIASCLWLGVPVAFHTVYRPFKIPSGAMNPTLHGIETLPNGSRIIGDHFFVNTLIYIFRPPRRGDIVVFSTKGIQDPRVRQGEYFVKRIVGLPGEHIAIHPPFLVVDGKNVEEPEFFRQMALQTNGYKGFTLARVELPKTCISSIDDEITLGADEYLALGDNSESSLDSRYYGPIHKRVIVGRISFIYFPFDRIRFVK